jgi:hypothetical protein
MGRSIGLVVTGVIVLAVMATRGLAADQQFTCKGQVVQGETTQAGEPKPIDLNLTLGDKNKLSMKTGDGKSLSPHITSNNKLQLKFATKEFVGEYFHYTGDLFLIYPGWKLARLSCSRS